MRMVRRGVLLGVLALLCAAGAHAVASSGRALDANPGLPPQALVLPLGNPGHDAVQAPPVQQHDLADKGGANSEVPSPQTTSLQAMGDLDMDGVVARGLFVTEKIPGS